MIIVEKSVILQKKYHYCFTSNLVAISNQLSFSLFPILGVADGVVPMLASPTASHPLLQ